MYFLAQSIVYLALALLAGGGIGFALRACLADTACDDVREDLRLLQSRYNALLETQDGQQTQFVRSPMAVQPSNLASLSTPDLEAALLSAAPGSPPKARFEPDDLTMIRGVTPEIDAFLARQGITRFDHIAEMSASELYWLVENLPRNGASVYRDQWVAQAARLAQER
jgi:predicted flap endonuclease-1-like 5' DNA nuclease